MGFRHVSSREDGSPVSLQPPFRLAGILCLGCLLVFPWLNPVASGPAPSVNPWLSAAACALVVGLFRGGLSGRLVALTWLVAATVSAWIGLLQYFGQAHVLGGWVHTTGLGDAFANLRQRNQFATLTSIGLSALLWLESSRLDSNSPKPWSVPRAFWLVPVLLALAMGNAASGSRTGMLQWCLIFALTVMWAPRWQSRQVALAGAALAAYVLAALLLPALLESATGVPRGGLLARFAEEPGCASRRVLWSNVLHLIAQKPWLGWGWGELDYAHFMTLYPGERFCDILDNAHNLPLHLAVELGVPLALGVCGTVLWWMARNAPWSERHPTRQMVWAVLAVIGLHSMLEYPLWYGPFQLALALSLYLLWQSSGTRKMCSAPAWRIGAAVFNVISGLLLLLLAVVAWDYWRVSQLYLLPADRAVSYREQTLAKVRDTRFFQDQVQFAELTTTQLDIVNAKAYYAEAIRLLHFSPEPRVVEAVIESAVLLGRDQEALDYLRCYEAAFPQAHAQWAAKSGRPKAP